MSKSAKGTIEEPGRQVSAKSGLNKSILDQCWYSFKRQLTYKMAWNGGIIVEVNSKHTSQRCSHCDAIHKENRLSQEKFQCLSCHKAMNADIIMQQKIY